MLSYDMSDLTLKILLCEYYCAVMTDDFEIINYAALNRIVLCNTSYKTICIFSKAGLVWNTVANSGQNLEKLFTLSCLIRLSKVQGSLPVNPKSIVYYG